jgi:DNA polymerase III epsilon subunit-like protein
MIPDNVDFIVADTETTGKDEHNKICELAWARISGRGAGLADEFDVTERVQSLIDPEQLISAAASGVHGLTNIDVDGSPTIEEFFSLDHPACYGRKVSEPVVLIGHRIGFDRKRLEPYFTNVVGEIDTLRWVRRLYPDSENHQLSTMVFALSLPRSEGAHRAMADVITAYHLVRHICDRTGMSLLELARASEEPFLVKYMPLGKHKGLEMSDVPRSYLSWMLREMDLDMDLKFSVESALNNKKKKNEHTAGSDA